MWCRFIVCTTFCFRWYVPLLESILQLDACGMSVEFRITTECIKHIMPVNTQIPSLAKLFIHGQATIDRGAKHLTCWWIPGIINHLHSNLPVVREIGFRNKSKWGKGSTLGYIEIRPASQCQPFRFPIGRHIQFWPSPIPHWTAYWFP